MTERFIVSFNGKSVDAIAVIAHVFLLVAATYAIFIQLLFAAAWNIVFNILLWNLHDGDRIKILGLVTFWNYPDPFSAVFSSFGYLTMLLRGEDSHNRKPQYLIPAVIISFCSTTIAVTSLVIGIYYPIWLNIQMSPPAHPAEVYFPDLGQPTAGAAINFGTFDRPSILRALGSAEAGELNTQLSIVSVELFDHPGGTVARPQQAVQWHYTLTTGELNMQIMLDLELRVNRSCATECGWLQPHPYINKADVYVPWDSIPNAITVSTDEGDGPILLGFTSLLHPEIGTKKQDLIDRFPSWRSHHKRGATQKATILGI